MTNPFLHRRQNHQTRQRNDQQTVGCMPGRDTSVGFVADQRVQQRLQTDAKGRIRECLGSQPATVEASVVGDRSRPERCCNRPLAGRACGGKLVRDRIGVDDRCAERGERLRDRRLAAADASGQSDDERHALAKVDPNEFVAEEQRQRAGDREIGPERQRQLMIAALDEHEPDADHRAHRR